MKKCVAFILAFIMFCTYCLPLQTMAMEEEGTDTGIGNTGTTFYVDADNGDDSNSGISPDEAWQTMENVNNTTFEPGDAILLKRGCVWTDQWIAPKGSGDKDNQNYISCYGDEEDPLPSIISRYADDMDNLPKKDAVVQLWEQSYWTIENLSLTNGSEGSGDQAGIDVTNNPADPKSAGIIIRNCEINGSNPKNWNKATKTGLRGIQIYGFYENILIENNHISNCKSIGIVVNGWRAGVNYKGETNETCAKGVVIRGNYLENIGTDGILVNNTYEPLVEHNVVYKSHSYATNTAHVALWAFASYGSLFQYNEAYDTQTVYDGQGFDCDYQCYNTTFQYNYSHDNVGGFMLICTEATMQGAYTFNVGSTVRYNISQNDEHYSFNLTGGVQNTRIYNNTIYTGRNTHNATHFFFVYDKGENTLTGLHYPDDVLVANNIFYTDGNCGNELAKCSNLVYKNNMFCGKSQSKAIENGEQTMVTLTKPAASDSNEKYEEYETYGIKESSGNIWKQNPMFVAGGSGGIGIDTCDGYQLYEDSPAIGAGIAIKDGHHACETDYYGNPIDADAVNIGAYAGKGVQKNEIVYDDKYIALFDFEKEEAGATGTGTSGVAMSGIERCNEASGTVVVTEREDVQNPNTNSSKCIQLKNDKESEAAVSMKYYLYENELENANGIRLWLDPNGDKTSYTVTFELEDKSYQKTFDVQKTGWKVLTFNESYNVGTSSTKELVTPEVMRKMTAIKVSVKLASGESAFVDDIQLNNGEMDETDPYSFAYDEADVTVVEDFETASLKEDRNNTYGAVSSGAGGNNGIREYNGGKAYFAIAESNTNTTAEHLFKWTHAFDNLTAAMAEDIEAEGIQITMDMQADDLTEEEMANLYAWDKYTFALSSQNKISYTADDGTVLTIGSFNYDPVADANNIIRIPFSDLYYKSGNHLVYLTDLPKEDIQQWKVGLYQFWIKVTTQGGVVGRTLATTYYMDDIALYKNVKHAEAVSRIVKEATCTEDGRRQKLCETCGAVYDIEVIPATGHNYEWVITKEATYTAKGEKALTCSYCGDVSETEEIPRLTVQDTTQEDASKEDASTESDVNTEDEVRTTESEVSTEDEVGTTTESQVSTEDGVSTTTKSQVSTEDGASTTTDSQVSTEDGVSTTEFQADTEDKANTTTAGVAERPTTEAGTGVEGNVTTTETQVSTGDGVSTTETQADTEDVVSTTETQANTGHEASTTEMEANATTAGAAERPTTEAGTGAEENVTTTEIQVSTTESQTNTENRANTTEAASDTQIPAPQQNAATNTDNSSGQNQSSNDATEDNGIVIGNLRYSIICNIEGKREVAVLGVSKDSVKKIVIPAAIKINGISYKVTVIYKNAFQNNKKLTSITIGKNVELIGKQAFYKCTKLKAVKLKTTKLTKKSVQSKAFAKGYKKIKITVPKKFKKAYKKILRARGVSVKATIK